MSNQHVLNEGKTKRIIATDDPKKVVVESKDDLTAGDGAKHVLLPGKGALATTTTCNVFRLLQDNGVIVGYHGKLSDTEFSAPLCEMIPIEVVVRRRAHGSYVKRNPTFKKGDILTDLVVEFYLKTNGRKWKDHDLVCDDPLMFLNDRKIELYDPKIPVGEAFLTLDVYEVFEKPDYAELMLHMATRAKRAFVLLEDAWLRVANGILFDYKVEFGQAKNGISLYLADVIDNDSWRVEVDGIEYSKQVFRDGGNLDEVLAKYQRVAEWTSKF